MNQDRFFFEAKRRKTEADQTPLNSTVQSQRDGTVDRSVCTASTDLSDLEWLLVLDCLMLTDKLNAIRVCRRWRALSLISCQGITELSFKNMFNQPAKNDALSNQLTDDKLQAVLHHCGLSLRTLDVSSTHHILTPRSLDLIGLYSSSLQVLDLTKVSVTKDALKTLAERVPGLKSLSLQGCQGLGDLELRWALKILQSLKSLDVSRNETITGRFFKQAPPSLTQVFAKECHHLSDKSIRFLVERCPNLEAIDITSCWKLTGQSLTHLAEKCPKLKKITLSTSRIHYAGDCQYSIHSFLTLARCLPLLEELHANRQQAVNYEVLTALGKHCPNLKSISCADSKRVTDASIFHLSACLHLENVDFSDCYISDRGLIQLSSAHPNLKKVYLRNCGITNEGVRCLLSACPNLLELDISEYRYLTWELHSILEAYLQKQHIQSLMICLEHRWVIQKE